MKDAFQAAGFAVAAAMAAFLLRGVHRQWGAAAALAAGLMLLTLAAKHLSVLAEALRTLSDRAGVGRETAGLLLRLTAMAYLTEFAVQACRDAGEEGLAAKAALCGKALLMIQTLPLVLDVADLALSLTP